MLINSDEINKILGVSGIQVTARGKKYFEQSRVKVASFDFKDDNNYIAKSFVEGTYIYDVTVTKENGKLSYSCNCPASLKRDTPCKHIIATIFNMYINESEYLNFTKKDMSDDINEKKYEMHIKEIKDDRNSSDIIRYYEELEMYKDYAAGDINIVPTLDFMEYLNELKISFKVGRDKMYKLKDLITFYETVLAKDVYKYGKGLEFKHDRRSFNPNSLRLLDFIVKKTSEYDMYSRLGSYYFNLDKQYKGVMILKYGALDDFFEIYNSKKVVIDGYQSEDGYGLVEFVDKDPEFEFEINEANNGIQISNFQDNYYILEGNEHIYMLYKNYLYRCSKLFEENVYPLLKEFKKKRQNTIYLSSSNCTSFCEYMVPRLKDVSKVNIDGNVISKYKAEPIEIKTYLDLDENSNVVCDVKFVYKKVEINPFDESTDIECNRNILKELKAKRIFKNNNFLINSKQKNIYLADEKDIYAFFTKGIENFKLNFDVYITEKLKKRQILKPRGFSMGVRVNNDLLNLSIDGLDYMKEELNSILKSYKLKKQYYRMKNGTFIDLESSGIKEISDLIEFLNISNDKIIQDNLELPKYRALYLEKLSANGDISIKKDEEFNNIVENITNSQNTDFKIPSNFNGVLREYQKTGFNWLKMLDKYNFGGILADDMGLGKTIQVIALLLDEKNKGDNSTSIVVCPSSLYLNWKKEINNFAPDIKALVINGSTNEREVKIESINDYDVVITSYDLLKRDIEKYKKIKFRYVIADEAQYIKNNNTKNSKALKQLKGITKFALTGTPIENSLSELWSIFDFCMPGYLYSYKNFKDIFEIPIIKDEDKNMMGKLRAQVGPFVLRRIKNEVLKELPDKTETIMYNSMDEEQKKVYEAYILKAKQEMQSSIDDVGFEKSKIKILALITRLRQICCHPSLFISNYNGTSSKLTQCLDLLDEAISSGHKILLFSQFTSMFDILKVELDKKNIRYMELTGKTKSDQRLDMVTGFNEKSNVKVFLISLKAGGTGLNLVGADVVIHFDPWWNLSVQNQATDRAHRIGQKKNVQVFKLITENSIEEKIQKLQEKKIDIANNVIKNGETFINKMSKEEIYSLFE